MYKLVVFDLDGTLANTLYDLAYSMNKALVENGMPPHDAEKYNQFVGNGINNLVTRVLGDKGNNQDLHKKVKDYFDYYYPLHLCDYTVAYDKMSDVLSRLSEFGIKTAVLTNKPQVFVPQILSALYPEHDFCDVIGNCAEFERKPSPQALEYIIEKAGVNKNEVLYVGDSDVDVFTAHNAGVMVCGVEWGFRGREELENAGADYIAKDADSLFEIIVG